MECSKKISDNQFNRCHPRAIHSQLNPQKKRLNFHLAAFYIYLKDTSSN